MLDIKSTLNITQKNKEQQEINDEGEGAIKRLLGVLYRALCTNAYIKVWTSYDSEGFKVLKASEKIDINFTYNYTFKGGLIEAIC